MKEYDVIVIGSGSGMRIVEDAADAGKKTALIDKGPRLGGTCMNYGCIPSKMLIHVADRVMEIRKAAELGVSVRIDGIDFQAVMERMRKSRNEAEKEVRNGIENSGEYDFFEGEATFVSDYTLEVNGEQVRGEQIFIASGSRPVVPPIKGLDQVSFLTNETALELTEKPESLIIIGGGYIGVEYAHFFEAMGTEVTVLEMGNRLITSEEPEIADMLLTGLRKRMTIALNSRVVEIRKNNEMISVLTEDADSGKPSEFSATNLMLAIGRRSNADLLKVENAGIEVDKRGFITVNEYFESSKENIYAIGDANGQQMFTHAANREAALAAYNALHDEKLTIDRSSMPHAVYSYPQIASVGLKEAEAAEKYRIKTIVTPYSDTAKGEAMMEHDGYAKAVLSEEDDSILGFHIVGPYAPMLIQEVVNAMASGGQADEINDGIHIHPSLSELIPMTLY